MCTVQKCIDHLVFNEVKKSRVEANGAPEPRRVSAICEKGLVHYMCYDWDGLYDWGRF